MPPDEDRAKYFDEHYLELATNPPAFGHFQMTITSDALDKRWNWLQTLRTLVTPNVQDTVPTSLSPYRVITAELPRQIVSDMREYLGQHNLILPEMDIVCAFAPELLYVTWD